MTTRDPSSVTGHSARRATEEAVRVWALASAEYPVSGGALIQSYSEIAVVDSVTNFATNGRRAMEAYGIKENIYLRQSRWSWMPTKGNEKVEELRDAFNRIIHAHRLDVGYDRLPAKTSCMGGGGIVIPYVMAQTDRKELSYIDPFAMAHAWLYHVLPSIPRSAEEITQPGTLTNVGLATKTGDSGVSEELSSAT